jgi:glycosyltransferase involved in cell wall biosynthesis
MHRILHIIPTLDRGGAEKQLVLLAEGLPRDEFELHVCALTRGGPREAELRAAEVPVTVIGKRWKADPLAFWKLRRHLARLQPALVHTWLFAAGAYGRVAARSAGVKRLIAGERCVDRWKSSWQWAIDRHLAGFTDRFVTNSTGVQDYCVAHGLPVAKFTVIPNGVPPARDSDVSRDELFNELRLPSGARLIGVVGRLWPQKRVKDLIWAADLVRVLHDNIRLVIIGDGPERASLEEFARGASDLEHIRFLGERGDVWRIMPHLDMLWQGSEYEGQPNSVMEAMACGVPVVASDIPGNRDLVVHGETGFLLPLGDRAAWGRTANTLLTDSNLATRLGAAGRERMLNDFSVERMVQRHVELYRELLA